MQFKNLMLFFIIFFTLFFIISASNIYHHLNDNITTDTPNIHHHTLPNNISHHPQPHKHLHANCQSDFECGRNALCVGGKQPQQQAFSTSKTCHCKLGFSYASNKIDCNKVHCSTDSTCISHFGHRTRCIHSFLLGNYCGCASDKHLQVDENSQTCVPARCGKGNRRNSRGCSEGMFCYYGRCRCRLGYLPLPNGYQCKVAHCRANSECQRFDFNARCFASTTEDPESEVFGVCECDHGFYLDHRSHLCMPNLESFTTTRNVFFIVASFIFLIPTVVCLIRACQRRRNLDQINQIQRAEMVLESGVPSAIAARSGSGIISPVNNAVSRHRILNVLVRLSGERNQMRDRNADAAFVDVKPPLPVDLPPSYEVVSLENTEVKNLDTFTTKIPSSSMTPPPPAYETVYLYR